jgi:two-component system cell cycle sensor histidine kinase/response regulator CckA
MTILAVDDEPLLRNLIASVLEDNGFAVLTADSGAQAIDLFREHSGEIDLLLSDIMMPGIDGPSLATQLQRSRPDLKVLLMSGYCDPAQLGYGFEFLPKPFDLSDLVAKVRGLLGGQRVHAVDAGAEGDRNEEVALTAGRT